MIHTMGAHYDIRVIKKQALKAIQRNNLVRIAQVTRKVSCSKNTFYDYKLHKDEDILEALENNKEGIKGTLRENWAEPGANPILQIGLYKLLGDDEEKKALGVQGPAQTNVQINVQNIKELSDDDLLRLVEHGRKTLNARAKNITPGAQTLQLG